MNIGSIFDFEDIEARIQIAAIAGDRKAQRIALDQCKSQQTAIPDWLWRALSESCKRAAA